MHSPVAASHRGGSRSSSLGNSRSRWPPQPPLTCLPARPAQNEMMYEVRGAYGVNECLAVHADDDRSPGETFPSNQWTHISLVHCSDGTASIFWDGRLKV